MKRCFRFRAGTDGGAGSRRVRAGRLQHRLDRGHRTLPSRETESQVDADAFPVTIEHAFGETTIEEEPTRVATLGWSDQDIGTLAGRRARSAPPS